MDGSQDGETNAEKERQGLGTSMGAVSPSIRFSVCVCCFWPQQRLKITPSPRNETSMAVWT